MAKAYDRLRSALDAMGAKLKRDKKHLVYELPNGRNFVVAKSPSDARGEENALSDLRAVSGVAVLTTDEPKKKAPAEVRAERRRRPGRHGEAPWDASLSPLSDALRTSGVVEQSTLAEVARLGQEVAAINRVLTEQQAAAIGDLQARLDAMERLWVIRAARWLRSLLKG